MKLPNSLYRRFDRTGRIPWWARVVWPELHWCAELDGCLLDHFEEFCCEPCGAIGGAE